MKNLRQTESLKHLIVVRLIAGLPLVAIGLMHITGAAPMRPILDAASIPLPGINAIVAPLAQVVAGSLILIGAWARVGALLASGAMVVAIYAHLAADWADEPPIVLPIAVLFAALYILWRGAGARSLDLTSRR